MKANAIYTGDCIAVMKGWPDGCVDMCITSPPYWGLRDYGVEGQLGLEKTPEEYVAKMVEVFAEVKRILAGHGTLWLNLGDSYNSQAGNYRGTVQGIKKAGTTLQGGRTFLKAHEYETRPPLVSDLKPKDLVGIPWRVALALQADGWYLRQDIIWHKPNPMPESCRDRCTKAHEYMFLLSKKPRYYYDAEAIKEANSTAPHAPGWATSMGDRNDRQVDNEANTRVWGAGGRNKRSVWTIPTQPMSEAHFATFPPKLVEPCILAGTSAKGYCPQCGKPWERVVDTEKITRERPNDKTTRHEQGGGVNSCGNTVAGVAITTTGWNPTCKCEEPNPKPGLVLDPFGGSGTVGVVAGRLKRNYALIELNPKYIQDIARPRLDHIETAVPVAEAKAGQLGLFT